MQNEKTKKTKSALKALLVVILVVSIGWFGFNAISSQKEYEASHNDANTLKVNDVKVKIIFAMTSQEKSRGLCCRDSLPQDEGMLFAYDQPGLYSFWMKDTRIPLDMYWLNESKEIIHIEHGVQPEIGVDDSQLTSYGPSTESMYILETNAGFAKKNDIQIGDKAVFSLPPKVTES